MHSTSGRIRAGDQKRKNLGQHFLVSRNVAARIADAAGITLDVSVFEIGPGRGILTRELCKRARHVMSVDVDADITKYLKTSLAEFENLQIMCGDGLAVWRGKEEEKKKKEEEKETGEDVDDSCCNDCDSDGIFGRKSFTILDSPCKVFVSNLPYSKSRLAVEQLASSGFERCVIMVQKEFAQKLLAGTDGGLRHDENEKRAISIVAQHCFEIDVVMNVHASYFKPPPSVDSVVLLMRRKNRLGCGQITMINKIFSYKRKQLLTVLRILCDDMRHPGSACDGVSGNEFADFAADCSDISDTTVAATICNDGADIPLTRTKTKTFAAVLASALSRVMGTRVDSLRVVDLEVSDVVRMADMLIKAGVTQKPHVK